MSYSTLYKINKKRKIEQVKVYRNSYGSAHIIWSYLCKKYLESDSYFGAIEKLWKLVDDERLSREEKLCLIFTFDHFTASIKNIDLFISSLKLVGEECKKMFPNYVNHLENISEDLEKLKLDNDCSRFCFEHTSVSDTWLEPNAMKKSWWFHKEFKELL